MAVEYFINERGRTSSRTVPDKKSDTRPLGSPKSWAQQTPGTLIAGKAAIDGADHAAITMEQKWGAGRLRLLVSTELREKFDRQRYLFNQAVWHGDLEAVRLQSARMTTAWQALDGAAEAARWEPLSSVVWEVRLEDGAVAAIVHDREAVTAIRASGRKVAVYTLEEIGRILSHHSAITEAKLTFPGATVEHIRRPTDPLDDIRDTLGDIDDPLNDPLPTFGV